MNDEVFMKQAIELAEFTVKHGNEPFGAILVKNGEVVLTNENQIYTKHDPTFHWGNGSDPRVLRTDRHHGSA